MISSIGFSGILRYLTGTVLVLAIGSSTAFPCSTFRLSTDGTVLVGHNLDQEFYTPGMIHLNRRGEIKRSVSSFDLGLSETETPLLEWSSKYGSVTFSLLGRGLPDGGVNEAGLTVNEMALGESKFPFNDTLPTMLAHQWIQYQLDMYATVGEMVSHLDEINVQPMSTFTPVSWSNYHAFVADKSGDFAIIEFLDGSIAVHQGAEAPVSALCNLPYERELKRLENYSGVLGGIKRRLHSGRDLRFVIAAMALEEFNAEENTDPVLFCFDLLAEMQFDYTRQWSIVYDLTNSSISFRTRNAPTIKRLHMTDLDLSENGPMKILPDIDINTTGDISTELVDYSIDADRVIIGRFMTSLLDFIVEHNNLSGADEFLLKEYNFTLEQLIDRGAIVSQRTMR